MEKVQGKVAVITGGASGIGFGMARAFAEAGMKIVLLDIEKRALADAAEQLQTGGAVVTSVPCDVSDRKAVFAAADAASAAFGKVHLICNNAGVSVGGPMEALRQEDWDWVIGVNQLGVLHGIQAFLPRIKAHGEGGHVVNTASMAGLVNPDPEWGPYNSTKFAVVSMSEILHHELKDTAIGVSILCPGPVRTRILEAGRNRPRRYGAAAEKTMGTDISQFIAEGLDPLIVGQLVLSAIRENKLYVFTEPRYRRMVERRHAELMAGFDWVDTHPALKAAKT